jgi:hypothetical protein
MTKLNQLDDIKEQRVLQTEELTALEIVLRCIEQQVEAEATYVFLQKI